MSGLLHLVQRGGAWALLCGFNVGIKGLRQRCTLEQYSTTKILEFCVLLFKRLTLR